MASSQKNKNSSRADVKKTKQKRSILDFVYVKLLRDASTNFIIVLVLIVFIIWMVIPLVLVLSGAIYLPPGEPINYFYSDALNADQIGNNTVLYSFDVPNDTIRVRVILEVPNDADFDISLWDESNRRSGGRTLVVNSTTIEDYPELNIENSEYTGTDKRTEIITVDPTTSHGNWSVGCYAISGDGLFQITVNVKPDEPGQFSGRAIANVFTDLVFFNFPGEENTYFHQRNEVIEKGPAHSIVLQDDIAFVSERRDGIEILNISDPTNIVEIRQYFEEYGNFLDLEIKDDLLFVTSEYTGITIFNISNVQEEFHPISSLFGKIPVQSSSSKPFFAISDDLAFLDVDRKGFYIIDISDPYNLEVLSNVSIEVNANNIKVKDGLVYLIGSNLGINVYNISNPYSPELLIQYDRDSFPVIGSFSPFDIGFKGDFAFVGLDNGIAIFDITNPLNFGYLNHTTGFRVEMVQVSGNYAYMLTEENDILTGLPMFGLKMFSIIDPVNVIELSSKFSFDIQIEDFELDLQNDLIYLAQIGSGLEIIDYSSITELISIGTYLDSNTYIIHTFSGVNNGVVLNTLLLGLFTTLFSVILGTALAFILARYEFPGKKLVSVLALAPLIIPPFISGMGFRLMLGPEGLLNNFVLVPLFGVKIVLTGFVAICFVQTSHFYALVYLNAFSSFLNIDPSMEESAENLGAGRFKLFFTVTLPLAMPGIGAGSILVLILSMEDVGTPIIFANMGDIDSRNFLTYYIFENYQRAGSAVITPEVLVLGTILLIIALVGFFAIRKYISLRKYAMVSKGRAGQYRMSKARWKLLFIYPFLIVLFAFSLLVHVGVFLMSILETLGPKSPSDILFTFEFYRAIFSSTIYNVPPFVINTLIYSIIATIVIIILGSVAAYVISRKDFKGKGVLDALVTLPIAIPGIVLALGFYTTFNWSGIASRNPNWFTNFMAQTTETLRLDPFIGVAAVTLLIMSYAVRKFPFTVRSAYAGLQQTDVVMEEASFNLGASRARTFARITIPLISLNVFAGSLVSFLYCLSEVSTTIFLIFQAKAGTITWFMAWNPLRFQIFCALGVFLMLLQILSLFITNVILGSRAEAITGI
jgi:ABC-type Fe3+ transport system permease subunit